LGDVSKIVAQLESRAYLYLSTFTHHLNLGRRRIIAWVSREDDIPLVVDVVDFGSPEVGRIIHAWRWLEDQLGRRTGPVGERLATEEGDIHIVGVGKVVILSMAEHPSA